jgi:hypothetical protein
MAKLKDKMLAMDNTIAQEMLLSGGRYIAAYVLTNSLKKIGEAEQEGVVLLHQAKEEKRESRFYIR